MIRDCPQDQLPYLPWLILGGVVMMFWILATYLGAGYGGPRSPTASSRR